MEVLRGDTGAERRQRVLDRVGDRRGGADHPAFADAAEVVLAAGRQCLHVVHLDLGDLHRGRDQVVHVRGRLEVGVLVVRRLLVQHRTDALRHAATDLAVDDRRVDDRAAVLDDEVPREGDLAGVEIDIDDAGVCRDRPAAVALAGVSERRVERVSASVSPTTFAASSA